MSANVAVETTLLEPRHLLDESSVSEHRDGGVMAWRRTAATLDMSSPCLACMKQHRDIGFH